MRKKGYQALFDRFRRILTTKEHKGEEGGKKLSVSDII
jgi:hypothetical protein